MGRGSFSSPIVIVGEAPGKAEAETGKPFMGAAGQILNRLLVEAGISDQVYITNIAKCRPPKNRKPTVHEAWTCTGLYLMRELEAVNPRVIICLGEVANRSFKMKRGEQGKFGNAIVLSTFHPAYYLYAHAESILKEIKKTFQQAKGIIDEHSNI